MNPTSHYCVDSLLERKYNKPQNQYLYKVKWTGYPIEESTWEPRDILFQDVPALVNSFEENLRKSNKIIRKAKPKNETKQRVRISKPKCVKLLKEDPQEELMKVLAEKKQELNESRLGFGDFSTETADFISKHLMMSKREDKRSLEEAIYKVQWKVNETTKKKAKGVYYPFNIIQEKCPVLLIKYLKDKALL